MATQTNETAVEVIDRMIETYRNSHIAECLDWIEPLQSTRDRIAALPPSPAVAEPVCANCKGALNDLEPGRDPEELCPTCYEDAMATLNLPAETDGIREAALEEAARVAEEHVQSCLMARDIAGAMNNRHAVWQAEAERLASISIAAAIRALATKDGDTDA